MKKNKWKINMVLIALIGLFVLAGCSSDNTNNSPTETPTQAPTQAPTQGITINDVEFEPVEVDSLSENILNELDQLKTERGYYYWSSEEGGFYVLIASGLKATGGYTIEVESVQDNEGLTQIHVIETSPGPDDMVTQAITYPFTVIYMNGVTDRFEIKNQDEESFDMLEIDLESQKSVEGVYVGQIDNNSIEVTVDDGFMVFRNHIMTELVSGLESGDEINVIYKELEDGSLQLIKIEVMK